MQLFNQDIMDCPSCGRRGLVKQSNDIYHCLCCGFRRNLSNSIFSGEIFWTIIALVLVTLVFGGLQSENSKDSQPPLQLPESLPHQQLPG